MRETQEIINTMPEEKLQVVYCFIKWIAKEELTQKELESIARGEKEIEGGSTVSWRAVARTV